MLSKLTLLGLHTYTDGKIWDDFYLPEGLDKETAISEILRQAAEFSILYANPEFLQKMIGQWCKKWEFTFEKWYAAINEEYNPLWNVDAHVSTSDNRSEAGSDSGQTGASGENTHLNAAYDSETFKNAEKDVNSASGSSSSSFSKTDNNKHEEYRRGNIGVTKSQDLLRDEINIRTWNLYSHIADIFCNELCICIYN